MALESIDMSGPEPAELSQPGIQFLKRFRFQPVETALCVHRGFHETGLAQHAQVLGHGRLRHTKLTLDLSDRLLGRDQEAQDRAAARLRDDFEDGFHALCILHRAYTCQGIFKGGRATVAEAGFHRLEWLLKRLSALAELTHKIGYSAAAEKAERTFRSWKGPVDVRGLKPLTQVDEWREREFWIARYAGVRADTLRSANQEFAPSLRYRASNSGTCAVMLDAKMAWGCNHDRIF